MKVDTQKGQHETGQGVVLLVTALRRVLCLAIILFLSILLVGCVGVQYLGYELDKYHVLISDTTHQMAVAVTLFSDERPPEEKLQSEREKVSGSNVGGYTCDEGFECSVPEQISKRVSEHLGYSRLFSKVVYKSDYPSQIGRNDFNKLRDEGFDAVLTGTIKHFYAFSEKDLTRVEAEATGIGLLWLGGNYWYGLNNPGHIVGGDGVLSIALLPIVIYSTVGFLEKLYSRKIEWHTQLSFQLVNNYLYGKHEIIWEDQLESYVHKNDRSRDDEYALAIKSLREVVNRMVWHMSTGTLVGKDADVHLNKIFNDSSSSFAVDVGFDSIMSILDGSVTLACSRGKLWSKILTFIGIIGVGDNFDRPFHDTSISIGLDDIFYVQVDRSTILRGNVIQEDKHGVRIKFERF